VEPQFKFEDYYKISICSIKSSRALFSLGCGAVVVTDSKDVYRTFILYT